MRFLLVLIALAVLPSVPAYAGNCDYSWQNASDGSSCGDRAANRRYGGK
jgi:hypothetical protein